MLRGLAEVEQALRKFKIPFTLLIGSPDDVLADWIAEHPAKAVVCDFSPLKISRSWKNQVTEQLKKMYTPLYEVDAHNIVPVWIASPKEEYGAWTFRPKLQRREDEFLTEFPKVEVNTFGRKSNPAIDWAAIEKTLKVDRKVQPVAWIQPGEIAAEEALQKFLKERLPDYATARNNPMLDGQSDLSPYLHFGHLSAQRLVWEVKHSSAPTECIEAFWNEAFIWREIAENYCFYQPNYDNLAGARAWAKASLEAARSDPREFVYTRTEFEQAKTHDDLWNAAQLQMVQTGKMHGYLRMYWAKKILEWTNSPEEALEIAIYLNDRYELDGRDPNGYAGIMWSITGLHDRPWFKRPIFGTVRFMAVSGAKKKFKVDDFIQRFRNL